MSEITVLPLLGLNGISLRHGGHKTRDDGVCAMEAVAWLAGEPHSDHPQCACPVIAAFVRRWNDRCVDDAERDTWLKPILSKLLGSKATQDVEIRRGYLAADWVVRTILLGFMRTRYPQDVTKIESLAPIIDQTTARNARDVVRTTTAYAAYAAAYAADAAADAAAYAAAYAAYAADASAYAAAAAAYAAADAAASNQMRADFVTQLLAVQ